MTYQETNLVALYPPVTMTYHQDDSWSLAWDDESITLSCKIHPQAKKHSEKRLQKLRLRMSKALLEATEYFKQFEPVN